MKIKRKIKIFLLSILIATTFSSSNNLNALSVEEIKGVDRYDTAFKISKKLSNYNTVILVNSTVSLADGLSASSLSGFKNAPIVPIKKDVIPEKSLETIKKAENVYIIGGEAAISKKVENQIISLGKKIFRINGKNRIETSKEIAKIIGNYDKAFIVNGFKGEADAMSVASISARDKAPILLTDGNNINHELKNNVKYYTIGGDKVITNKVSSYYASKRLFGKNRYETNRVILNNFYKDTKKFYCTDGNALIDALTSSLLAKDNGMVFTGKGIDTSILKNKDIIKIGKCTIDNSTHINKKEYFKPIVIDEKTKMKMDGFSMPKNHKGITYDDLRKINIIYYGFDDSYHNDGVLIVNKSVAKDISDIFNDLYKAKYPIEKINMIDEYSANDELSMSDNNTSSFCYRLVNNTKVISKHSKGLAIDINPLYNPQVKNNTVYPANGKPYIDRNKNVKGMIKKGDACYNAFILRGWKWGGNWKNVKDYQHFEK
ncbi:cell wall-binding repeat-containing protein [Peptacetobacter sp.]|uniref:cell wall-binding repeat-containing protein n=1 Tax=Peptacetobacter sp. TaxID=2991975 RepID=UPI00262A169E|nr:cell wall-binding repeat-containing protein [Peptacetobacter sp.]